MAEPVKIVYRAVDETSKVSEKVARGIKEVGNAGEQVTQGTRRATGAITDLHSAMSIANQVMQFGQQVYQATISQTVDYAMTVKDAARAMGASSQEASALIQIADDARIEVSSLKVAFRNLNDNGIAPNIDNLKKLADQYNALPDSVSKAQFAAENFGMRAGPEMQKLLELGSAAIDDMARSAEEAGLIMDDQAVQAAEDYRLALDNLNDQLEGAKYRIGNQLIPALTELLRLMEEGNALVDRSGGWKQMAVNTEDLADATAHAAYTNQLWVETLTETTPAVERLTDAQASAIGIYQMQALGITDMMRAQDEYRSSLEDAEAAERSADNILRARISALQAAQDAYFDLAAAQQQYAEAEANYAKGVGQDAARALEKQGVEGQKYRDALDIIDDVLGTNLGMQEDYNKALEDLAKEYDKGKLSGEEFKKKLEEIKNQFKPLDESLMNSKKLVQELRQEYDLLKSKTITLTTIHRDVYEEGGGGARPKAPEKRAYGGPVWPNEPYLVGERGPEWFIPAAAGQIAPAGPGGMQVTIEGDIVIEGAGQNASAIVAELFRRLAAMQRGGATLYAGR